MKTYNILIVEGNLKEENQNFLKVGIQTHTESLKDSLSRFDNDYNLSKLIHNSKTTYIFLSTRKVYKPKANIKENDKLLPKSNYSKNKLTYNILFVFKMLIKIYPILSVHFFLSLQENYKNK